MDIRQLSAFVAVVDYGTFSAAARALHTVQSNVSTHVARLERELGCVLIDRSVGALTEEGEAVLSRARRIQAELAAIPSDISAMHDEVEGLVRAGIIGSTARWLVPSMLKELAITHPGVQLQFVEAPTSSLLPQVVSGTLDGALINLPVHEPEVSSEVLFEEDLVLVAPPDHPLAQRSTISAIELADQPLLLSPGGTAFRDRIDQELSQIGVTLVAKAEVDGMHLLASLAFEGYGATLLPASTASEEGPWRRVTVEGLARRSVGLVFSRRVPPSATTRAVRDVLYHVVKDQAPGQPGIYPA